MPYGAPSGERIVTLGDAKTHLNIASSDTTHDAEIGNMIEAATGPVEGVVGPIVTRTHSHRFYGGAHEVALPHTQVTAVTALVTIRDGTSPVALADLDIDGKAGLVRRKDGACLPAEWLLITYTVGRSTLPAAISLATLIIIKHEWETQLGNLPSIQGDSPGYVVTGQGYLIPYRAMALLEPYSPLAGFA